MSLVNNRRPTNLDDYIGQQEASNFAKRLISRNLFKDVRSFAIVGPSGVGKTQLATLIARSTLCINRLEGSYLACGECDVCKGLDTSNIEHYTISNPTEAKGAIEGLKSLALSMPVVVNPRPDNNYRFIILDEFELATPELAARMLDPIEYCPATTVWIINSMDPDKMERRDPIVKEAIDSRCVYLRLTRHTDSDIANNLISYCDIGYEAALAIAKCSGGNMRSAWNELIFFTAGVDAKDLTEDYIISSRYGGATNESRRKMWNALQAGDASEVVSSFKQWLKYTEDKYLSKLIEEDLLDFLGGGKDVASVLASLARWHMMNGYSLVSLLLNHLGCDLFTSVRVPQAFPKVPLGWSGNTNTLDLTSILNKLQPKGFFEMNSEEIFKYCS